MSKNLHSLKYFLVSKLLSQHIFHILLAFSHTILQAISQPFFTPFHCNYRPAVIYTEYRKTHRSLKKFLSISFALGISCERRVFAPLIDNSLKVSSLITAKLLLRRRLHVSDFPKFTLLCSCMMSLFCPWAVTIQNTKHGKNDYRLVRCLWKLPFGLTLQMSS